MSNNLVDKLQKEVKAAEHEIAHILNRLSKETGLQITLTAIQATTPANPSTLEEQFETPKWAVRIGAKL